MLATAFQVLHYRKFIQTHGNMPHHLLEKLHSGGSESNLDDLEEHIKSYEEFTESTRKGEHVSIMKYQNDTKFVYAFGPNLNIDKYLINIW